LLVAFIASGGGADAPDTGFDGHTSAEVAVAHQTGNSASGKRLFRFETIGHERFWTVAVRPLQGSGGRR